MSLSEADAQSWFELLARVPNAIARSWLQSLLLSEQASVSLRVRVLHKIGEYRCEADLPLLRDYLNAVDGEVRAAALAATAQCGSPPEVFAALLPHLKDPSLEAKQVAVDTLNSLDPSMVQGALETMIRSTSVAAKASSLYVLRHRQGDSSLQLFRELAKDPSEEVRRRVAEALEGRSGDATEDLLQELLNDGDIDVAEQALETLQALFLETNRDLEQWIVAKADAKPTVLQPKVSLGEPGATLKDALASPVKDGLGTRDAVEDVLESAAFSPDVPPENAGEGLDFAALADIGDAVASQEWNQKNAPLVENIPAGADGPEEDHSVIGAPPPMRSEETEPPQAESLLEPLDEVPEAPYEADSPSQASENALVPTDFSALPVPVQGVLEPLFSELDGVLQQMGVRGITLYQGGRLKRPELKGVADPLIELVQEEESTSSFGIAQLFRGKETADKAMAEKLWQAQRRFGEKVIELYLDSQVRFVELDSHYRKVDSILSKAREAQNYS